jgi:hypothetical protein
VGLGGPATTRPLASLYYSYFLPIIGRWTVGATLLATPSSLTLPLILLLFVTSSFVTVPFRPRLWCLFSHAPFACL